MQDIALGQPALSMAEYVGALVTLAENKQLAPFRLTARLPTQGRADIPLAATDKLSVVLKAYASGGENALHAHVDEDHCFIVLQGSATFYGEGNRLVGTLEPFQGIMVPRGALYRFEAGTEESLVMLRVGTVDLFPDPVAAYARVDESGMDMDAYSAENKEVELRYDDERWFPAP